MLIEHTPSVTDTSRVSLRRLAPALALIALCLPTLLFVWNNRDVPHFGVLQDDGMYFIDGKALAEGAGYRILSLPAQPFDTRYPPLYPLYLSLAWRAVPSYPANLAMAVMLSWLCLPVVLLLGYWWCVRQRFSVPLTWLTVGLFALNPYVLFFVSNLGSEMMFMVFLFGAMLAAERSGWRWALLAGVLGGAAYLARTSGIALLPAAIAYYCWKKQARGALWFTLGMLPAVAGWAVWSRLHAAPGHDVVTLCYTNYLGYYFTNVGWDNIGHVLARNTGALLEAMGSLVFPQMMEGWLAKVILWPLAVAMIVGCVRMVRQGYARLYALFAAGFGGDAAGLALSAEPALHSSFGSAAAGGVLLCDGRSWRSWVQQGQARAGSSRVRDGLGTGTHGWAGTADLHGRGRAPAVSSQRSRECAGVPESLYAWIAQNLPADASVLWQDDTALYLATGRHSVSYVVPPREFEATGGDAGEALRFRGIDRYAREQHLGYVLLAKVGLRRNAEVLKGAAADPGLELVHEEAGGVLYRVR